MVGLDQAQAVQADGFSCKEELLILGTVIAAETAVIVSMAKIGWNHITAQLKEARDHSAALEVTLNSARKKKGESPT
jgi:hypothetical protein